MAETLALDPALRAALERRDRRAQHERCLAPDDRERRREEAPAHATEVLRVFEEGEVVQRHDERRRARWNREAGRMDQIDLAGGTLDARSPQRVPGLVQERAGERQRAHGDARAEVRRGRLAVPGRDPDERHAGPARERVRQPERRDRRAAGNRMPALFEHDGDAQRMRLRHRWLPASPRVGGSAAARSRARRASA